jgi:hypothetical protein
VWAVGAPRADQSGDAPELVALTGARTHGVQILPAPRRREWMDETNRRSANRCLPLLVANEAGWVLSNPHAFEAVWDGAMHPSAITLSFDEEVPADERIVRSHFGSGVVTWGVPYLFRTAPGWNLLARGPANWPIDGACALEGIVETDWSVATFTMNWKLTRPGTAVRFEAGDPFCMIVPQRRGDLESVRPAVRPLSGEAELDRQARQWSQRRHQGQVRKFLAEYAADFADDMDSWEKDYFRGRLPDGTTVDEHQTKLRLRAFDAEPPSRDD